MTADLVVTDIAATNDPDDLRGIADRAIAAMLEVEARNERALDVYRKSPYCEEQRYDAHAQGDCKCTACRMARALVDPTPDTSWARIKRALDLHTPIDTEFGERCTGCGGVCPCPTRRALEGVEQ